MGKSVVELIKEVVEFKRLAFKPSKKDATEFFNIAMNSDFF